MRASASAGAGTSDSRGVHPRTSQVPTITGIRLSPYGAAASLVNISASGVLVECTMRLKVESPVLVIFEGAFQPGSAPGRVTRCEVAAMGRDGLIRYHVAIAFSEPIPFEVPASPSAAPAVSPAAAPAHVEAPPVAEQPAPAQVPAVRNRW
jgi:hypothetical protein